MVDTTYNGWTNYQTWLVNLWLEEIIPYNDTPENVRYIIEDYIGESYLTPNSGLLGDMVQHFLSEVNYHEIADNYKQED